ncbi:Dps family protein [Alteromonas ponticola]|uniref:DNA starvation/stationary phase protection protein n=1 Tax=Alteromonas ponticola TaxID=2720613 RepID=A0ABX1R069_9ALTE|nr:Dps family protein [Alteromonas ponticola]NMH59869.1 DNA starvation/stationary phase protection protein [Alteromonas ponticola]
MAGSNVLDVKAERESLETGIDNKDTKPLAEHLSRALADTYILRLQTQGVHWNVVGPSFYSVHKLTEEQYEDLADAVDEIAERIRALGQISPSSFAEFERLSVLDSEEQAGSAAEMLQGLIKGNELVASRLRKAVGKAEEMNDVYTADLLTARIGVHEEAAWMLRSLAAK